jgi:hypothetical protein
MTSSTRPFLDHRGILVGKGDLSISRFSGLTVFSYLDSKKSHLETIEVFYPDFTVRKINAFRKRQMYSGFLQFLIANPYWIGRPILSQPLRTYTLGQLRTEIKRRVFMKDCVESENRLALKDCDAAKSYDELFELVPPRDGPRAQKKIEEILGSP